MDALKSTDEILGFINVTRGIVIPRPSLLHEVSNTVPNIPFPVPITGHKFFEVKVGILGKLVSKRVIAIKGVPSYHKFEVNGHVV